MKLNTLHELRSWLDYWPYSIELYIEIANAYVELGYPDLAVGAAYKALLLVDACKDESDEYHEEALDTVYETIKRQPLYRRMDVIRDHKDIFSRFDPNVLLPEEDGKCTLPEPKDDEINVWINEWYSSTV